VNRYTPTGFGSRALFAKSPLVVGDGDRGDADHRHPGRTLESVAPVLGLYYRAIAGRNAAILPDGSERDPERYPDTHTTIRLPARVVRFPLGSANFDWYKVALTHRAAHYTAGTFAFRYDRDARSFERWRPPVAPAEAGTRSPPLSDLERFFSLFALRELAIDVFTVIEALRIDEWAKRRYPGLAKKYEAIQRNALNERAEYVAKRSPRDALAEILIQASLGATNVPPVPALLHEPVRRMLALCREIAKEGATVEDSAEATMRAYVLIARLPNLAADYGPATPADSPAPVGEEADSPSPLGEGRGEGQFPEPERNRLEGDEVMHTLFEPVLYRDHLGSRITLYKPAGPLDQQAIYRFTDAPTRGDEAARTVQSRADVDDRPEPPPEPMEHDHHDHFAGDDAAHESGELHSHERMSYIYPEWDHVRQAYRRAWCRVREARLDTAPSARFFDETLRAYGSLVPGVRRELERVAYEGLRRVHRLPRGEEIDLDAAIEHHVDLRAGLSPDDDVYLARTPQARDVTLALLIDASSSTAEHAKDVPPGPMAEALAKVHGRAYRTILDVEKEALVLLIAALERIGDTYGIYAFSGTGREDVKFQVLKDLDERLSDTVAGRFEKMRGIHTTRMGAALRHAIRKLRAHESKTKVLLMLSDGRPFDIDYGQEYGDGAEVPYAQNDTRQALVEAQRHGIRPFLITVDPHGNDYLREMCDGIGYEILGDVSELPLRLVSLYRALTA
jgi:nitric oxide reductase NorD protein